MGRNTGSNNKKWQVSCRENMFRPLYLCFFSAGITMTIPASCWNIVFVYLCVVWNGHGPNTFWECSLWIWISLEHWDLVMTKTQIAYMYSCFSFMVEHGPRFQRNPRLGRRHFEIVFTGLHLSCEAQHVKLFFHQLSLHLHHSVFPTWRILVLARPHLHSLAAFENMCSPGCVWEYTRRNNLMPTMCFKRPHV